MKLTHLLKQLLEEQKKKADRCKRIADRKYDKPSAYKSGAIVRCRKGEIWKDLKEEDLNEAKQVGTLYHFTDDQGLEGILTSNQLLASTTDANHVSLTRDKNGWHVGTLDNIARISLDGNAISNNYKISPHAWDQLDRSAGETESEEAVLTDKINNISKYITFVLIDGELAGDLEIDTDYIESLLQEKNIPYEIKLNESKKETLRTWFKRKGAPGKEGGWVDCNTCRDGKCKPCGRKKGEKRAKYPSCRPTPAQCKTKGKGKKWGKTK